jgi:hypothetical protein
MDLSRFVEVPSQGSVRVAQMKPGPSPLKRVLAASIKVRTRSLLVWPPLAKPAITSAAGGPSLPPRWPFPLLPLRSDEMAFWVSERVAALKSVVATLGEEDINRAARQVQEMIKEEEVEVDHEATAAAIANVASAALGGDSNLSGGSGTGGGSSGSGPSSANGSVRGGGGMSSEAGLTIHEACLYGRFADVERLVNLGVDLESRDAAGSTPLHIAASERDSRLVAYLLSLGANPNSIRVSDGTRPLHLASDLGVPDSVDLLLEHGAQPNSRDRAGESPIIIATRRPGSEKADVMLSLVKAGARRWPEPWDKISPERLQALSAGRSRPQALSSRALTALEQALERAAREREMAKEPRWRDDRTFPTVGALEPDEWIPDEASSCCLICRAPFSTTRRRHHCRACGLLVCGLCSTRRFRLVVATNIQRISSDETPVFHAGPGPSPTRILANCRVDDGCFNRLSKTVGFLLYSFPSFIFFPPFSLTL